MTIYRGYTIEQVSLLNQDRPHLPAKDGYEILLDHQAVHHTLTKEAAYQWIDKEIKRLRRLT